jgi:8-oxo-dGTP pyrophosphatase MutT (NUDIX family)
MDVRILCRALIVNDQAKEIILVRNHNANFWYAPGGEWMPNQETLKECVEREIYEEVGISIDIVSLVYVRVYKPEEDTRIQLELFWAAITTSINLPQNHRDEGGIVEEAHWFRREQVERMLVFPNELKSDFWRNLKRRSAKIFIER